MKPRYSRLKGIIIGLISYALMMSLAYNISLIRENAILNSLVDSLSDNLAVLADKYEQDTGNDYLGEMKDAK